MTATTTLYLVRHGENPANLTREFSYNLVDYALTPRGIQQAEQTANYFARLPIAAIYASPLKRAAQTAEIIARPLGQRVHILEQFREVHVGTLEGRPATDADWALHDSIFAAWHGGAYDTRFPDGEDYTALLARMRDGLARVVAAHTGQRVIIVAHGGIFAATLKDICANATDGDVWRQHIPNCAICELHMTLVERALHGELRTWAVCDHLLEDEAAG